MKPLMKPLMKPFMKPFMKAFIKPIKNHQSKGFTLVEVMISSLIASVILIICLSIYFSSMTMKNQSKVLLDGILEEASIIRLIQETIEFAGFLELQPAYQTHLDFFPATPLFSAGQILRITGNDDDQTLLVRFKWPEIQSISQCNGEQGIIGDDYIRALKLKNQRLYCQDLNQDGSILNEVVVSDQVEVLYFKAFLQDQNNKEITRYKKRIEINDLDRIKAIQVFLLTRSKDVYYKDNKANRFEFEDFEPCIKSDRFKYRKLLVTIEPKNTNIII